MFQKQWWHEKTAYQIYPKSFCDSNGDGIGDLKGIISKLDYLRDLGVEIVWLSPIYRSPMADQGYDISDYYQIDPIFGTMEDMDRLLLEAGKRDLHIVMDLVVNHCSDEHPWFQKACEDPDGPYGKYFYIEKITDGNLPNNWRSNFGGSVWDPLPGQKDYYYLHSFHKKQPDLNWENPDLRKEIYTMINWWLKKGLSGFRIDAILGIKKPDIHTSFPADRADGLCGMDTVLKAASGIDRFLDEMRRETFQKFQAFTVGEVFTDDPERLQALIGNQGHFSTIFDFSQTHMGMNEGGWYLSQPVVRNEDYKQCVFQVQKTLGDIGFLSNIIENHDLPRGVSRFLPREELTDSGKKMLGALNLMMRGLPFIYQGQELGMTNVDFPSIDQVDDCSTKDQYAIALRAGLTPQEAFERVKPFSRDNTRTPFHWNSEKHAGFTTGTPWLMVNPNYTQINAQDQRNRKDSVFSWYQSLIALRKNPEYQEAVVYGELIPYLPRQKNLMAFFRKGQEKTLLVAANYQKEPQDMVLPSPYRNLLLNNEEELSRTGDSLHLKGYQLVILEL